MLRRTIPAALFAVVFCFATLLAGDEPATIPDSFDNCVKEYLQLAADGNWEQADAILEMLSEQHPDSPGVQLMREHAQLRQAQLGAATEDPESLGAFCVLRRRAGRKNETERITQALKNHVDVDFEDVTLEHVVQYVAKTWGINIVVDEQGLAEVGATLDTTIDLRVGGIQLQSVLKLILIPLDLGYVVEDEVIKISSSERLAGPVTTRVYSVSDLIPEPTNDTEDVPDADVEAALLKLAQTIQDTIDPNSWSRYGGSGYLQPHVGTRSLVIRQRPDAHQQITDLLNSLRREVSWSVAHAVLVVELSAEEARRIGIDAAGNPVVMDAEQAAEWWQFNELAGGLADRGDAESCTLRNRQTGSLKFSSSGGEAAVLLNAAISEDRRTVRIALAAPSSFAPEDVMANVHSARVPDSGVALFVLDAGDSAEGSVRVCVVVPKIVVGEEEEERLGKP